MSAVWNPQTRSWTITMWSSAARRVSLIVVDRDDPERVVSEREMIREGDVWTSVLPAGEVGDAEVYGFRVTGPDDGSGRFDPAKLLLDPDAGEVWFPAGHDRDRARVRGVDSLGCAPMAVLPIRPAALPRPAGPHIDIDDLVIYEIHVRGATMRAPQVPGALRGTFAGLEHQVERIRQLGVTAVELLPVHQFDPDEGNYWGYMPLAWNALHHQYVAGDNADREFAALVQSFHEAGIEVILDVVYNHSTEEDELGPTYHLRGIDDSAYYVVDDDGSYHDDAGCGNVIRAAHPAGSALILGSLARFADLGVDGFRFDLGTLLARDLAGDVQLVSPLIDAITAFAADRRLRLIVEPWDLTAYQIGDEFPGRSWAQWNGKFRDAARAFLRAEAGATADFAKRVVGSPDLYGDERHRSVNFITAHDGFTLYDLVSYERKHNHANGHGNADGNDDNHSWNCGWEGDDITADIAGEVNALRHQQMRNAMVLLMLSGGVPMMLAGDEFAQTQHGNNNAYNQDNETTWLDWGRAAQFAELTEFVRKLIELRRTHGRGDIVLHGVGPEPDLGWSSHSLAWRRGNLYVMANAWWEPLTFRVDEAGEWSVVLSSCAATGALIGREITLAPRSTVVLANT